MRNCWRTGPRIFSAGDGPAAYPRPLAAVTQLALDKLAGQDAAAANLVAVCAFLAPEAIPADWFANAAKRLPAPIGEKAADPVAWRQVLAQLTRSALARVDRNQIQMHRLTQAIIRSYLTPAQAADAWKLAVFILIFNDPGDPNVPGNWPGWTRILPHLLALDPAATSSPTLRDLACHAATYLVGRGDASAGHDLARHLYQQWRNRLGPDDPNTGWIQGVLAYALREIDQYEEARDLTRTS